MKNANKLIIEKAKVSDGKAIVEYLNIVGGESDNLLFGEGEFRLTVEQEEEHIKNLNKTETSALFIGKVEGEIVSVASFSSAPRKRIAHHGDLAISVKKEFWGLGIGYAMIEKVKEFAKANGITKIIHLGVRSDNENAIKLYKKCGFEEIGVFRDYFKIGDEYFDEILMNYYF